MALPSEDYYRAFGSIQVDLHKVLCFRCGKTPVHVYVERGCKPPPKMCYKCKLHERHTPLLDDDDLQIPDVIRVNHPPVTIYRPGDEGFEELASLYVRGE